MEEFITFAGKEQNNLAKQYEEDNKQGSHVLDCVDRAVAKPIEIHIDRFCFSEVERNDVSEREEVKGADVDQQVEHKDTVAGERDVIHRYMGHDLQLVDGGPHYWQGGIHDETCNEVWNDYRIGRCWDSNEKGFFASRFRLPRHLSIYKVPIFDYARVVL